MAGQEEKNEAARGRVLQKNRTRMTLVAAAQKLMQAGKEPTVSEAAEAAQVSRATAYRYFPTQGMLLAEVALFAAGGPLVPAEDKDAPLPEAVARLVRNVGKWSYANEQHLRSLLRLSLDPASGVKRPGHRRGWIADVLKPARGRMDARTFARLSKALALLLGIDPIVVMRDVAGAPEREALDTLEWTARVLVTAALQERNGERH